MVNTPETIKAGRARSLSARCAACVLGILRSRGSRVYPEDLAAAVSESLDFDDWDLYRVPSTGAERWKFSLDRCLIDMVAAGLVLVDGVAFKISASGESAHDEFACSPSGLLDHIGRTA